MGKLTCHPEDMDPQEFADQLDRYFDKLDDPAKKIKARDYNRMCDLLIEYGRWGVCSETIHRFHQLFCKIYAEELRSHRYFGKLDDPAKGGE